MVCLSHFRKTIAKSLTLEIIPRFTISTWTEPVFLHTHTHIHNCRKKKIKSKQLPNPKLCCQRERKGEEAWKEIRVLAQLQTKEVERRSELVAELGSFMPAGLGPVL